AARRLFECRGIEIDGVYHDLARGFRDGLARHDRDRIGLFPGRASGRKQAQGSRPLRRAGAQACRQNHFGKRAELLVIAKEISLADGELARQSSNLVALRLTLQTIEIGVRRATKPAEPALEDLAKKAELRVVEQQAGAPDDRGSEPLQVEAGCL